MTRLDTAGLHAWLTDATNEASTHRDNPDAFHRLAVYIDIDGQLRTAAVDQLHTPGTDLDPSALLRGGNVRVDHTELREWVLGRAAGTPFEVRRKTYQAVANQLHRFAVAPDPFPFGDDTPGWAAPAPRTWPHRLVMVYQAARDLVR